MKQLRRLARAVLVPSIRVLRGVKSLDPLVSRAFQEWYELPFAPTHYYSPLPDLPTVKRNLHRRYVEDGLAGVRMDLARQRAFLESLAPYRTESESLPSFDLVSSKGIGLGYGEVEAHFLHCLIRHFKPRRIVEVGSGVSTFFALNALEVNQKAESIDSSMICIEP